MAGHMCDCANYDQHMTPNRLCLLYCSNTMHLLILCWTAIEKVAAVVPVMVPSSVQVRVAVRGTALFTLVGLPLMTPALEAVRPGRLVEVKAGMAMVYAVHPITNGVGLVSVDNSVSIGRMAAVMTAVPSL